MSKKYVSPLQNVFNTWAVVLIIWSFYRINVFQPEWFDELIAKPVIFILPVYLYIKHVEHGTFLKRIWLTHKKMLTDLYIGIFLSAIFTFSALFANYIRYGDFHFTADFFARNLPLAFIITFATAVSEEILSRGFILKRLYEDSKNVYSASFLASVLFLILHIPILFTKPELNGSLLLLFLGTDFILSLVNSFVYLDRKSLLAPILIHAFYNIAILFYI